MKKITKIAALAVLVMGVAAMLQPANAVCSSARLFTTGYSYVFTPGCEAADCGTGPTSLTDDAAGVFWAIGDGNDAPLLGIDNGTFPLLGGWAYVYPGYPALISSTWAASGQIDGCIDAAADPQKCMAIMLSDNDPDGNGAFALLTDEPDSLGNYDFTQDGDITMVSLGKLSITTTAAVEGTNDIIVTVDGVSMTDIAGGLYLDPACPQPSGGGIAGVLQGYQLYQREVPYLDATTPGPAPDGNIADWTPVGALTPLGDPGMATVSCTQGGDLYVTSGLVFDSAIGNVWLSGNSTKLNCNSNLADPGERIQRKPRNRELPRSRSLGR